jgi:hypothetical protein
MGDPVGGTSNGGRSGASNPVPSALMRPLRPYCGGHGADEAAEQRDRDRSGRIGA